jgi:hypothetical protein
MRVLDAFTSGGAQQSGGQRTRTLEVEDELEFTLGRQHQITATLSATMSDYRGDENSNRLGTYTFESLADFAADRPTTFTQRMGEPAYEYSLNRYGWLVQDDYRVRRNLMINLGFRHDFQSHVRDWANFSPRVGISWTPSSRTRTVLRGSIGTFYSQMDAGMYRQILLVNGRRQWDLVISNPGYPDPLSAGTTLAATPPSIIRARADLEMPFNRRYSIGVDQPLGSRVRFRGTVSHQTWTNLFRSRNANAPVDGVRPDSSFLNIIELESTARSLKQSAQADVFINYEPLRLSATVGYVYGRAMDEADGPFSLPRDPFDLAAEWGAARSDARHKMNVSLNSDLPGRFRASASYRAQTALPYNITTGTDPNGDGIYNERPVGVTRNTGRGAGTQNLDLTLTWGFSFGERHSLNSAGSGIQADASSQRRSTGLNPVAARDNYVVRIEVFARAYNAFNVVNPQNFSGVLTSPFFGLPTAAAPARRVVLGTRAWF